MILSELELIDENPAWQLVLAAYREKEQEAAQQRTLEQKKAKVETADSVSKPSKVFELQEWTARFVSIDGVPDEELSSIHGKLIAYGFLKFKLLGRTDGLGYQLTRLGKQGAMSHEERAAESEFQAA